MPDLTADATQQAIDTARNVLEDDGPLWHDEDVYLLARAVLALTEQQPEPPKRYRIDGPYSNGFELVDTADTVLGTYASRRMVEVECDRLERRHREQSRKDTDV